MSIVEAKSRVQLLTALIRESHWRASRSGQIGRFTLRYLIGKRDEQRTILDLNNLAFVKENGSSGIYNRGTSPFKANRRASRRAKLVYV
jgi:hypothetical protein